MMKLMDGAGRISDSARSSASEMPAESLDVDISTESLGADGRVGPQSQRIIDLDRQFISPSYTRPYPLAVRRARGLIVEDADGIRYLDFTAGIAVAATGHCHPAVVEAVRRQAGELLHMSASDFYQEGLAKLARKLADSAPGPKEKRVFFCNSGAEAVEAAIKLARWRTGRGRLIAFQGAFHGRTLGALSLTASKPVQREGFGPLIPGVTHAPYPRPYRRPAAVSAEEYGATCARTIEDLFASGVAIAKETAAIVVEPVLGEGGYVVPPASFLRELRRITDEHGILLVFDEVQSGMGRTGRLWACEHFGVTPDILISAKGLASGMPLGAIIAPSEIMQWPPGSHASTFGGNPVCVAAATATIELLENGLMENAARVGAHILKRAGEWPQKYPRVGDVRGIGLMIGIELVADPVTKKPDAEFRDTIVQQAFRRGLLMLGCGESTLRLSPPLIVTEQQAGRALDILEQCLGAKS
jgi:4-aminobutyrate aminotransferase